MSGVSVEIGADTKVAERNVERLDKVLGGIEKRLEQIFNKGGKIDSGGLEGLEHMSRKLSKELEHSDVAMGRLSETVTDLERKLARAQDVVKKGFVADPKGWERATDEIKEYSDALKQAKKSMDEIDLRRREIFERMDVVDEERARIKVQDPTGGRTPAPQPAQSGQQSQGGQGGGSQVSRSPVWDNVKKWGTAALMLTGGFSAMQFLRDSIALEEEQRKLLTDYGQRAFDGNMYGDVGLDGLREALYTQARRQGYKGLEAIHASELILPRMGSYSESDVGASLTFNRAIGGELGTSTEFLSRAGQLGLFSVGGMQQFADYVATAIRDTGQMGRAVEAMEAMQSVLESSAQANLVGGVQADSYLPFLNQLMGSDVALWSNSPNMAASFVSKLSQAISGASGANKALIMSALGYDGSNLLDTQARMEQGATVQNLQSILPGMVQTYGGNRDTLFLAMQRMFGLSANEFKALEKATGGFRDLSTSRIEEGISERLAKQSADTRGGMYRELDATVDELKSTVGDKLNPAIVSVKEGFVGVADALLTGRTDIGAAMKDLGESVLIGVGTLGGLWLAAQAADAALRSIGAGGGTGSGGGSGSFWGNLLGGAAGSAGGRLLPGALSGLGGAATGIGAGLLSIAPALAAGGILAGGAGLGLWWANNQDKEATAMRLRGGGQIWDEWLNDPRNPESFASMFYGTNYTTEEQMKLRRQASLVNDLFSSLGSDANLPSEEQRKAARMMSLWLMENAKDNIRRGSKSLLNGIDPDDTQSLIRWLRSAGLDDILAGNIPSPSKFQVQSTGFSRVTPEIESLTLPSTFNSSSWRRKIGQSELDYLWSKSIEEGVDPRLMLSILTKEGNGSFNTKAGAGGDGGGGFNPNWHSDVDSAVSLIAGKVKLYPGAVSKGFQGSLVQYLNWNTGILRPDGRLDQGVYAEDDMWWMDVSNYYNKMGGPSIGQTYTGSQKLPWMSGKNWTGAPSAWQAPNIGQIVFNLNGDITPEQLSQAGKTIVDILQNPSSYTR